MASCTWIESKKAVNNIAHYKAHIHACCSCSISLQCMVRQGVDADLVCSMPEDLVHFGAYGRHGPALQLAELACVGCRVSILWVLGHLPAIALTISTVPYKTSLATVCSLDLPEYY